MAYSVALAFRATSVPVSVLLTTSVSYCLCNCLQKLCILFHSLLVNIFVLGASSGPSISSHLFTLAASMAVSIVLDSLWSLQSCLWFSDRSWHPQKIPSMRRSVIYDGSFHEYSASVLYSHGQHIVLLTEVWHRLSLCFLRQLSSVL